MIIKSHVSTISTTRHWINTNKTIRSLPWLLSWLIMNLFLFLANFSFDESKFSPGITSIKLWAIRLARSWNWSDSSPFILFLFLFLFFLLLPFEGVLFLIESDYGNASGISDVANVNNLKWPWEAGLFEIHWICWNLEVLVAAFYGIARYGELR